MPIDENEVNAMNTLFMELDSLQKQISELMADASIPDKDKAPEIAALEKRESFIIVQMALRAGVIRPSEN